MKLNVLNSGSKANGYILHNETEALVLECGVSILECQKVLNYQTKKIVGAFISHEHGDHCKYVDKYLQYMPVFASKGTSDAINSKLKGFSMVKPIKSLEWHEFGGFKVMPFDTQHDGQEPTGYLVKHQEIGCLLFATDTYFLKYKFQGLTNIMLECNYIASILEKNVQDGIVHPMVQQRTHRSHMSLDTCISTLKANDLSKVSKVVLLHLSNQNSDAEIMTKEVVQAIGKQVFVAKKGLELTISRDI